MDITIKEQPLKRFIVRIRRMASERNFTIGPFEVKGVEGLEDPIREALVDWEIPGIDQAILTIDDFPTGEGDEQHYKGQANYGLLGEFTVHEIGR